MVALEIEPEARASRIPYAPLPWVFVAAAVGIGIDRVCAWPFPLWCLLTLVGLLCWWCDWALRRDTSGTVWLLCAAASLSGAWHHLQWHLVAADHLATSAREEPQPVCVEAILAQAPRHLPIPPATPLRPFPVGERSRCELTLLRVREGTQWRPCSGRARLYIEGYVTGYRCGDHIRVFAKYQVPTPALNPGEFDVALYERADGRLVQLSAETPAALSKIATVERFTLAAMLDETRRAGHRLLQQHLSAERAPLATAVMLGEREYLDAERNERFLVTGTIHLLAISGVNLAILVSLFWLLGRFGWLSRRGTLISATLFSLSYALLTDSEPPVLRAAMLVTVFCLARWQGRMVSPWQVLATAALVVLTVNPAHLFHVGAQLSFLAVGVLVWFRDWFVWREPDDPLDRLIARTRPWPVRWWSRAATLVWHITLAGLLVWFFSLPLVWHHYHLISPVGIGLNVLLAGPMTVALFSGFLVLVAGPWFPAVGIVAGWVCDGSLLLLEGLIRWSQPLPGGFAWLPSPPLWIVALFYLLVGWGAWRSVQQLPRSRFVCAAGVWFTLAWYVAMPPQAWRSDSLVASFVSVGHGTSVLLELPDGRNLLYDCGRLGSPRSGARPIASVLWSRGITHLDAVILSHADLDHYNALPELLERFSVGQVVVSTVMWAKPAPGLHVLRQAIENAGVPITSVRAGDEFALGAPHVQLSILHPPRGGILGSDNANSLVLLVEHAGRRLLLTGDLEERGMSDLLSEEPVACDVVLAPHHGSTRSNPVGFALWCQPRYVVISGRHEAMPGRGAEQVERAFQARRAEVLHTSLHGLIECRLSAAGTQVRTFRQPPESP